MLETIIGWLEKALDWVLSVLPDSPFAKLDMSPIQSILPYINWVIPVNFIMTVTEAWLGAITIFYIYSAIMRWIKML